MGPALFLYYQQEYGNFYFLNASAVGQTDHVLRHYNQRSPNTFFHRSSPARLLQISPRVLYFGNVQTI
jgi:hypothetical protein